MLVKMKAEFGPASSGSVTRYLVNAGPLGADSWYRNEGEGTRFAGEGGHFLDTLGWWTDSLPEEVYAVGGGLDSDDVQVTVRFASGASAVISYLTDGSVRFPKETLDATGGGRSARLDNFRKATVWSGRGHETIRARGQDKGQRAELARFVDACLAGTAMPIPLESLAATTRATIAVRDSLLSGKPEQV
jgi:predicted dehydrogenase